MQNRRHANRTSIIVDVKVENGFNQQWFTRTKDVSETGAYLLFSRDQQMARGESLTLKVQSNAMKARPVEAQVVRTDLMGVGVRFT